MTFLDLATRNAAGLNRADKAQVYAVLAIAEALQGEPVDQPAPVEPPKPTPPPVERHPLVEQAVLDVSDGRTVGDIIDALGFDGFPIGVVGPAVFALVGEGRVVIDADQRVFRA